MATSGGPELFVRYAYPPNERGYCGPEDTGSLLEYGRGGTADAGFVEIAQAFTGAWPYLELIAGATGIADPLDRRVVEAYWVGNDLLDRVGTTALGTSMEDRFRRSVGRQFSGLAEGVGAGGVPHHSFHVFCVYPWVGLLGNDRMHKHALSVLDKCRIREARVVEITGGQVVVASRPLEYDGRRLALGSVVQEVANGAVKSSGHVGGSAVGGLAVGGLAVDDLAVGDWVSVHWDWICDRLTDGQVQALRRHTTHHLTIVNDRVGVSGVRLALD